MCAAPLSTLISSRPLHHHRYDDDIQIFISIAPKTFIITLSQLQDAISNIWSWMTSNPLSFNQSKTEFMLVGPLQQISKIDNPSLSFSSNHPITPAYSAHNLDYIFNSSLTFSKHISSLSSACKYRIRDLRRLRKLSTSTRYMLSLLHTAVNHFT